MAIRILLADDQEIVRTALRMLLQAQPDLEIVAEAKDGAQALTLCCQASPDVAILDIDLPGVSGLEVTRQIKQHNPAVAVLALTIHEDALHFFETVSAGASGYIPKRAAPNDVISAVHAVASGQVYVHPTIAGMLVESYRQRTRSRQEQSLRDGLTSLEYKVVELIASGVQNKEIAQRLGVSLRTVARYQAAILHKLGLRSRAELVRYAADIPIEMPTHTA